MRIYIKSSKKGIDAWAEYDPGKKTVIVKAGSRVSEDITEAPSSRSKKVVHSKREGIVKNGVLQQDVQFLSFSTSATFVYGSDRNGWLAWKNENGRTMKELFNR